MQIQVLINFGGVETGEKRILPGIYHHNDPSLLGLSGYLVKGGWARVVSGNDGKAITNELEGAMALGELLALERIAQKTGEKIDARTITELVGENLEELKDGEVVEVKFDELVEKDNIDVDGITVEIDKNTQTSLHGLGIPAHVLKALTEAGVHTLEQVNAMEDEELIAIEGVGSGTVRKLRALVKE